MKQKPKDLLIGLISLSITIGAIIWLLNIVYAGIVSFATWFLNFTEKIASLETVLIIAVISGAITVSGIIINSIISVYVKLLEHRNSVKSELRKQMKEPYDKFVSLLFDMLMSDKGGAQISEQELMNRMIVFSKEITLWGSNNVVKKWSEYRNATVKSPEETLFYIENVLFAIRKDLGIKNGFWFKKELQKGDLLSLFVNDIKDYMKKNTVSK